MTQLDLFADFLDTAWSQAKFDVSRIENHPNVGYMQLVAYQEVLHWSGSGEVQGICLILEGSGKNPYHLGNASVDLEGFGVCVDAIDQSLMLTHPGRWRLNPCGAGAIQWTPWNWKNNDSEQRFMRWHSDRFSTWTSEAWQAAKSKGHIWRPAKEDQ